MDDFVKSKIIDFVIGFVNDIDKDIKEFKIQYSARARAVARQFLQSFDG